MPPRAGTPVEEADTLAASEALFLADLAAGKYDKQVAFVRRILVMIPGLGRVVMILDILLRLNKMTAPKVPVVADGRGGFVPISNSRYDPRTGFFVDGPFS